MKQYQRLMIFLVLSLIYSSVFAIDASTKKNLIVSKHELSKSVSWKKYIYYIDKLFLQVWSDDKKLDHFHKKLTWLKESANFDSLDKKTQYIIHYLYWKNQIAKEDALIWKTWNCNTDLSEAWKDVLNKNLNKDFSILEWCAMDTLLLTDNNKKYIPKEIWNLSNLQYLHISWMSNSLPKEIWKLTNLKILWLSKNQIDFLPKEIWNLTKLTNLYLTHNNLSTIPKEIWNLKKLQTLNLSDNNFVWIPYQILELQSLEYLHLNNNKIISITNNIWEAVNLKVLTLNNNNISTISQGIGDLKKLIYLELKHNNLTSLPKEIGELSSLTKFKIEHNNLKQLPNEISKLKNLDELLLYGNDSIDPFDKSYAINYQNSDTDWNMEIKYINGKIQIEILK